MRRHQKERDEVNRKWAEIEPKELDRLRAEMGEKKQKRMNGKLQPRFFQVMYDWGVLKLMDDGRPMVKSPFEFTKWNRANAMIESADRKEEDRMFNTFPEEREKAEEQRRAWMIETKKALFGVSNTMKLTSQQTVEN